MKVYHKLPTQQVSVRKNTIDLENAISKSTSENSTGKHHMIKRGYYAKLGIERIHTGTSSVIQPSAGPQTGYVPKNSSQFFPNNDEKCSKVHRKSLSNKNISFDALSLGSAGSNKEHSFEEAKIEERKTDLPIIDELSKYLSPTSNFHQLLAWITWRLTNP